jgi:hypothetical protein
VLRGMNGVQKVKDKTQQLPRTLVLAESLPSACC